MRERRAASLTRSVLSVSTVLAIALCTQACSSAASSATSPTNSPREPIAKRRAPASDFAFEQPSRLAEPYQVVCAIAYRTSVESTETQEQRLRLRPREEKAITMGPHTLKANFFSDPFEGSSVNLRVDSTTWLFQFKEDHPPLNQFLGGHGFTGLIYVSDPELKDDLQFFCGLAPLQ